MDYVLRLQALDGYMDKFNTVFGDRFSRVLCVHHTGKKGDNPHYHFALTTDYRSQALRVYLKGHFDLAKGNRHLSLKSWDGDTKACSYMFHEGTEALIQKGFSDQEVEDFKKKNEIIQEKYVRPHHIVDTCVEYFRQKGDKHPSKRDVFMYMIKVYRSNGEWIPNKFQAERVINKIKITLCENETDERLFAMELFNEYFPYN